jgi:hypothetical protein
MYETKATGKEQYHNNFGCYGFITQAICCQHFGKDGREIGWRNGFYVKNDL